MHARVCFFVYSHFYMQEMNSGRFYDNVTMKGNVARVGDKNTAVAFCFIKLYCLFVFSAAFVWFTFFVCLHAGHVPEGGHGGTDRHARETLPERSEGGHIRTRHQRQAGERAGQ